MRQAFLHLFLLVQVVATLSGCGADEPKAGAWIGKTFLLDTPAISISRWEKPPALGSVLLNYAPQFLIAVDDGGGGELAATIATAQEYVQDPCTPTIQATIRRADYPGSRISIPAFPMHIVSRDPTRPGESVATLHDVEFENVLPGPQEAKSSKLRFIVEIPTLCPAMDEAGIPCETCLWNGERVCQTVEIVDANARETPTLVEPVGASGGPLACP